MDSPGRKKRRSIAVSASTEKEILSKDDSLATAMSEIASMHPAFRRVCFMHQLYAFSDASKTSLDASLEKHKECGDVCIFQTQLGMALMKNIDYLEELRRAESEDGKGEAYYSALRKFSVLMSQYRKVSITHTELTQSHGFSSVEVTELLSALFLLSRRDVEVQGLYWLYWPRFSHVLTDLTNMRAKMLRAIKRSRFKEMSASALRAVVAGGGRGTSTGVKRGREGGAKDGAGGRLALYYFMDLVGSGHAKAVLTPGGNVMYRLS